MSDSETAGNWMAVIGRSLAYLCLQSGDIRGKTLSERAIFLEALGLERKDVAEMLGSTSASVTEVIRQAKLKKRGARRANGAKKKK